MEDFSVYNTNIFDEEALLLAENLTVNSTLKVLHIGDARFGSSGWRAIFTGLQTASALEKLVISGVTRGINDSHMPILWEVIRMGSLKELVFDSYPCTINPTSISAQGLQTIAYMLESPNCKLEKLHLRGEYSFNDDVITVFVRRLANNTCLKELGISSSKPPGSIGRKSNITMRGWEALSTLLCDMSSIDNTYSSNHTLSVSVHGQLASMSLQDLSSINKNNSISDAARKKIIMYQFNTSEDGTLSNGMQVISQMDLVVLPQVIAWAGRKHDNEGCTILYQLLRCIPELVEDQTLTKTVVGEKRKLK